MSRDLKIFLIGFVAGAIVMFLATKFISCNNTSEPKTETKIIYDSSLVKNYLANLKKDTAAVSFIERIVREYIPAKIIYVQKLDTVTIEKIKEVVKKFDVMLKLEKDGFDYTVTAFNEEFGVLKELHFRVMGDKAVFTSKTNDVDVQSSKFDWKGINLFYQTGITTDSLLNRRGFNSMQHIIGIETELAYKNTLTFGLSQEYEIPNKALWTKAKLKFYPFR